MADDISTQGNIELSGTDKFTEKTKEISRALATLLDSVRKISNSTKSEANSLFKAIAGVGGVKSVLLENATKAVKTNVASSLKSLSVGLESIVKDFDSKVNLAMKRASVRKNVDQGKALIDDMKARFQEELAVQSKWAINRAKIQDKAVKDTERSRKALLAAQSSMFKQVEGREMTTGERTTRMSSSSSTIKNEIDTLRQYLSEKKRLMNEYRTLSESKYLSKSDIGTKVGKSDSYVVVQAEVERLRDITKARQLAEKEKQEMEKMKNLKSSSSGYYSYFNNFAGQGKGTKSAKSSASVFIEEFNKTKKSEDNFYKIQSAWAIEKRRKTDYQFKQDWSSALKEDKERTKISNKRYQDQAAFWIRENKRRLVEQKEQQKALRQKITTSPSNGGGGDSGGSMTTLEPYFKSFKGYLTESQTALSNFVSSIGGVTSALKEGFSSAFEKVISLMKMGVGIAAGLAASFVGIGYAVKSFGSDVILSTERMRGYNIALLALMKTQTGVNDLMKTALDVSQDLPIAYDQVFKSVKAYAMIGPLRPMLQDSKNLRTNLEKLNSITLSLSQIEPEWGIEGAIFSLREALSGDLLSLKRRFEIPVNLITTVDGKKLTEIKNNPMKVVDALSTYFQGIFGKEALQQTSRQFGTLLAKFEGVYSQFKTKIGESGIYDVVVDDMIKLRDYLNNFINSIPADKMAKRISNAMTVMYESVRDGFTSLGNEIAKMFGSTINFNSLDSMLDGLISGLEYYAKVVRALAMTIKDPRVWTELTGVLNDVNAKFKYMKDLIVEVAGSIYDDVTWVGGKINEVIGEVNGKINPNVAKGLIYLWLFGPGNAITLFRATFASIVNGIALINTALVPVIAKLALPITALGLIELAMRKLYSYKEPPKAFIGPKIETSSFDWFLEKWEKFKTSLSQFREWILGIGFDIYNFFEGLALKIEGLTLKTVQALMSMNPFYKETEKVKQDRESFQVKALAYDEKQKNLPAAKTEFVAGYVKSTDELIENISIVGKVAGTLVANLNPATVAVKSFSEMISGLENPFTMMDLKGTAIFGTMLKGVDILQSVGSSGKTAATEIKATAEELRKLAADTMSGAFGKKMGVTSGYRPPSLDSSGRHRTNLVSDFAIAPGDYDKLYDTKFLVDLGMQMAKNGVTEILVEDAENSHILNQAALVKAFKEANSQIGQKVFRSVPGKATKGVVMDVSYIGTANKKIEKAASVSYLDNISSAIGYFQENLGTSLMAGLTTAANAAFDEVGSRKTSYKLAKTGFNATISNITTSADAMFKTDLENILTELSSTGTTDKVQIGVDALIAIENAKEVALNQLKKEVSQLKTIGNKDISEEELNRDIRAIEDKAAQATKGAELFFKRFMRKKVSEETFRKFGVSISSVQDNTETNLSKEFAASFSAIAPQLGYGADKTNQMQTVLAAAQDTIEKTGKNYIEYSNEIMAKNAELQTSFENLKPVFSKGGAFGSIGTLFTGMPMGTEMSTLFNAIGENAKENIKSLKEEQTVIQELNTHYYKFLSRNKEFQEFATIQQNFANSIKALDFTKMGEMRDLFGQLGSMNRENKKGLFSAYESSLEQRPQGLSESIGMGMASAVAEFKNQSELMYEVGKGLVGDLTSAFETGFFDFMTSKISTLGDLFKSIGNSIKDTILKIIAKIAALETIKIVLGVDISGSMGGGGGLLGALSGGGQGSGGVLSMLTGGGSGGQGGIGGLLGGLLQGKKQEPTLTSTILNNIPGGSVLGSVMGIGSTAAKTGGISSILKGGLSKVGKFATSPLGIGLLATSFLSQPGRVFGGTVDHTATEKGWYSSAESLKTGLQDRRTSDAAKYMASGGMGEIAGYQFGANRYWETKSGDGIFSKKTKSGNVDTSAFYNSVNEYYRKLYAAGEEHYSVMRSVDKLRETDEKAALMKESSIKQNYLNILKAQYAEAASKNNYEKMDDLRDKILETGDELSKMLDDLAKLAEDTSYRAREFEAYRRYSYQGNDEVGYQKEMLKIAKDKASKLKSGTIEWYDAQQDILSQQKTLTDSLRESAEALTQKFEQGQKVLIETNQLSMVPKLATIAGELATTEFDPNNMALQKKYGAQFSSGTLGGFQIDVAALKKFLEQEYANVLFQANISKRETDVNKRYGSMFASGETGTANQMKDLVGQRYRVSNALADKWGSPEFKNEMKEALMTIDESIVSIYEGYANDIKSWISEGYVTKEAQDALLSATPDTVSAMMKSMSEAVRQQQFTGGIFGNIKDFESGSDFTSIFKEMQGLGIKNMETGLSQLGGMNVGNDAWQSWFDDSYNRIKSRIENTTAGEAEYFSAVTDMFNLLTERSNHLKDKAEESTQKMEDALSAIDETLKLRIAEERKTQKGDIIFMDTTSTSIDPAMIADLRTKIKAGDPSAAALLEELKRKINGTSR